MELGAGWQHAPENSIEFALFRARITEGNNHQRSDFTMLQSIRFENPASRSTHMLGRSGQQERRALHCIAVNPRGVSEMSGLWFRSAEEADAAFDRMTQSHSMKQHTLERFRLLVDPELSDARLSELVIAAVQWEAYLPIIAREGVRSGDDVQYAEPMGAYELAWPHDADPEVGIRPRG